MKERIGFIGLGLMGHGMAKNIVAKGWPLAVLGHRKREAIEDLKGRGASEVGSPHAMAGACDIVVLCVTGSPQVEAVIMGENGLASAGAPLLIIDCSTSEPASTIRLAGQLAGQGITLIDAPLGRTPKDAWDGTLDVMVGGAPDAVQRARPVLEAFAGRVVQTGPVGTGHTMKLLNNFLSMGYAALYSEALMIGAKAGLTPKVFDSVIRDGRMDCPFLPDLLQIRHRARPQRPSVHDRQRSQGRHLSGRFRPGAGCRQPGRSRGAQQFRARGRHGSCRGLRADALGHRRRHERNVADGLTAGDTPPKQRSTRKR